MSRYYQLIVFLTVYCFRNNCDQAEPSSHQLLCKDLECKEPIGEVLAIQPYPFPDALYKLKFHNGDRMKIYGITKDGHYYLAELKNRRGLVKLNFVKEEKQAYKQHELLPTSLDGKWLPIKDFSNEVNSDQLSSKDVDESLNIDQPISEKDELPSAESINQTSDKNETLLMVDKNSSLSLNADSNGSSEPLAIEEDILKVSSDGDGFLSDQDREKPPQRTPVDVSNEAILNAPNLEGKDEVDQSPAMEPSQSLGNGSEPHIEQNNSSGPLESSIQISKSSLSTKEEFTTINPSQPDIDPTMTPEIDMLLYNKKPISTTEVYGTKLTVFEDDIFNDGFFDGDPSSEDLEDVEQINTPTPSLDSLSTISFTNSHHMNTKDPIEPTASQDAIESSTESTILENETKLPPSAEYSKEKADNPIEVNPAPFNGSEKQSIVENPSFNLSSSESDNMIKQDVKNEEQNILPNNFSSVDFKDDFTIKSHDEVHSANVLQTAETIPEVTTAAQDKTHETISELLSSSSTLDNFSVDLSHSLHQNTIITSPALDSYSTETVTESLAEHHFSRSEQANTENFSTLPSSPEPSVASNSHESTPALQSITEATPVVEFPSVEILSSQINPSISQPIISESTPSVAEKSMDVEVSHSSEPINEKFSEQSETSIHETTLEPISSQLGEQVIDQMSPTPEAASSMPQAVVEEIQLTRPKSAETEKPSPSNFDYEPLLASSVPPLPANSASPSEQVFNSSPEPSADVFTQTFTETPLPTDYLEAMRQQLALLTSFLPEPVTDYFRHINFSPSVFVILILITFCWIVMFISQQCWTSHKEEGSLRDQLCRSHAELFRLKGERDTLLDELISEKDKYKHHHKEYAEMKQKLYSLEIKMKQAESEKLDLNSRLETLTHQIRKQQHLIEQSEKSNESLKNEVKISGKELKKLENEVKRLTQELEETTSINDTFKKEFTELKALNDELSTKLESSKAKEKELLSEKEALGVSLEQMEQLKLDLEKKDQEIEAMKLIIEDHLNNSDRSIDCSVEELLDFVKLKAELNVAKNQLVAIKDEKGYLATRMVELEVNLSKLEEDAAKALKAKEEAITNLEILKTYFSEKEVKMQSELGALRLKYDEITKRTESVTEYINDLEKKNEDLRNQVDGLRQEINKSEAYFRKHMHMLENKCHEMYLTEKATRRDLEEVKRENDMLRYRLTLKSQGASDESLKHDSSLNMNLDSSALRPPPPPPIPGYQEDTRDRENSWSSIPSDAPPPPPPLSNWLQSNEVAMQNYGSTMASQQPPPPVQFTQRPQLDHSFHSMSMTRDTYSPVSQRSHDQRSVRSDISHSSAANPRHHIPSYGPPPPVQTSNIGPFSNPIPPHWSVNAYLNHSETHNNNDRNYFTGER